ncbi:hypothetical protein GQS_00250 [Thermococcus sp. 4557]|uniref:hypothetical protein n=1 Tax=Thermococcus sp. (strain CGMCC 1.5172 / 4557) TaxID=1042877 RepID=UPI000219E329|nr:hypothetical protein [Thermococcus sp. 4557]AEK71953.1 hypothetical protein GQS_00250 [Thermococcus sp. 4557]
MGEIMIKVPAGVDLERLKKLLEADAEFLAKAMKKKVHLGILGKASVEELEEYAWRA